MEAIAKDDLGAFDEIIRRYQHFAWRVAYRFLGDSMEAEDVAQEAFLRLFKAAPRYRAMAGFRTYLYSILYRLCIDYKKHKQPTYTDTISDMPASFPDAVEDLISEELGMEVRRALYGLPLNQRTAIVLKHHEGLSYAEISQVMDITIKSVEMLIHRAREKLQRQLAHLKKA